MDRFRLFLQVLATWVVSRYCLQDLVDYLYIQAALDNPCRATNMMNYLLDRLINDLNQRIKAEKVDVVQMFRIKHTFHHRCLGALLTMKFKAEEGRLSDLSSIRRSAQSMLITSNPRRRIFVIGLRLDIFTVEFPNFILRIGTIRRSGSLSIQLRENCIDVEISMTLKRSGVMDRIMVEKVRLIACGDYAIQITGFGDHGGNQYMKRKVKSMLKKYQRKLQKDIELELRRYIQEVLNTLLFP